VKTIRSIPLELKGVFQKFDIRGEIILPFAGLKMNQDLIEIGETPLIRAIPLLVV
jgi:NAD-dependent DNA ligase